MHVRRTNFIWSFLPKTPGLAPKSSGKWIVEAPASAFFERFQEINELVETGSIHHVRYTHPRAYREEFREHPFLAAFCEEGDKDRVRQVLLDLGLTPKEWRGPGIRPGFFEREEELGEELERRNPPDDTIPAETKDSGGARA